jgi:hypothetical protein
MREAWLGPALDSDAGMNIGPDRVDLSELKAAEEEFLQAAKAHVEALTTLWWHRGHLGDCRSGGTDEAVLSAPNVGGTAAG